MNEIGPILHGDRPTVIAFGSGKGGTGKSTLCTDVARALTRYDCRVLCVDTDWSCPSLNILLGCSEPSFSIGDDQPGIGAPDSHIAEFIVPTEHQSVYLASIASARRHPFTPPSIHADEFVAQLHELDFDWILVDLANRMSGLDAGLFTLSDIPVVVATPEPASIRMSTQFLRAALFRAIGYHPQAASLEGEILDVLYNQPLRLNARRLRYEAPSADSRAIIDDTLDRFETYMIVNLVREGAEHDLGFVFSHALHRELQLFPRVLSSVEYADRRWFYNRRTTGANSNRNGENLSNEIELLARSIRDIELVDKRYPRPVPSADDDAHPALKMGLNPELSRNEVRQYCRRLWEGYRRETALSLVFDDPDRRQQIADELEQLYRHVLTMPSGNFADHQVSSGPGHYDHTSASASSSATFTAVEPEDTAPDTSAPRTPSDDTADSAESDDAPPTADGSDDPDTTLAETSSPVPGSPGETLAELRRDESMSLQELSSRTHIGVKYLAAIEETDLDVLPRRVYLRGYLREIARIFGVEPDELIDDYFRFLDEEL